MPLLVHPKVLFPSNFSIKGQLLHSLAYLESDCSEDLQLTTEEARTVTLAKKMKFSEMPAALRMAEIAPCSRSGSVRARIRA